MKRYFIVLLISSVMLIISACENDAEQVVGEYDTSKLSNDFDQNNDAYSIGANKDGMPVFKDTARAFEQALIDYEDGFKAIQEEFDLEPVSNENWESYKTYGWQLTSTDETIQQQGNEITQFFDIYENSFK